MRVVKSSAHLKKPLQLNGEYSYFSSLFSTWCIWRFFMISRCFVEVVGPYLIEYCLSVYSILDVKSWGKQTKD